MKDCYKKSVNGNVTSIVYNGFMIGCSFYDIDAKMYYCGMGYGRETKFFSKEADSYGWIIETFERAYKDFILIMYKDIVNNLPKPKFEEEGV